LEKATKKAESTNEYVLNKALNAFRKEEFFNPTFILSSEFNNSDYSYQAILNLFLKHSIIRFHKKDEDRINLYKLIDFYKDKDFCFSKSNISSLKLQYNHFVIGHK